MKINKKSKGFTLIELMVVISIIALLSSIILASITSARDSAKAAVFKEEVEQFINALELYRIEKGNYPGKEIVSGAVYENSTNGISLAEYVADLSPFDLAAMMNKYIKKIPLPTNTDAYFTYYTIPELNGLCGPALENFTYAIVINLGQGQKQKGFENWFSMTNVPGYGSGYKCYVMR